MLSDRSDPGFLRALQRVLDLSGTRMSDIKQASSHLSTNTITISSLIHIRKSSAKLSSRLILDACGARRQRKVTMSCSDEAVHRRQGQKYSQQHQRWTQRILRPISSAICASELGIMRLREFTAWIVNTCWFEILNCSNYSRVAQGVSRDLRRRRLWSRTRALEAPCRNKTALQRYVLNNAGGHSHRSWALH